MMALVVSADGTGSPVLPGKLRLYIIGVQALATAGRSDRLRDCRGKLSDIIMRMRAIVRLLLVDRIVYTILYNLALSASEC